MTFILLIYNNDVVSWKESNYYILYNYILYIILYNYILYNVEQYH